MDTRRSKWDEDKDFTTDQVVSMSLKKYNNLLNSGRWSNKDPKYVQILSVVLVDQNLSDNSNKSSYKSNTSNRESTKVDLDYIRDLLPWILEEPNGGV